MTTADAQLAQRLEVQGRFFQVLSDPTRLKIIHLLLDGEKHVSELVAAVGLSQGRVSNHLSCLRWCGYVETRREGKRIYYRIADPRIPQILRLADAITAEQAAKLVSCLTLATEAPLGEEHNDD
jgi:DNA-binding transcriptional ArsR family regulator